MIFQCYSLVLGDPSVLVRLVHDGQLNLDKMEDHTEEELRTILGRCGASITPASTKVSLSLSFFLSLSVSLFLSAVLHVFFSRKNTCGC